MLYGRLDNKVGLCEPPQAKMKYRPLRVGVAITEVPLSWSTTCMSMAMEFRSDVATLFSPADEGARFINYQFSKYL